MYELYHRGEVGLQKVGDGGGAVDVDMHYVEASLGGGRVQCGIVAREAVGVAPKGVGIGAVLLGVEQHDHLMGESAEAVGMDGGGADGEPGWRRKGRR